MGSAVLCEEPAHAQPVGKAIPTVKAPDTVSVSVGDWAFFNVTSDGVGMEYIIPKGLFMFPSEELKDPTRVGVRATVEGTYYLQMYTGNANGASKIKTVTVIVVKPPPNPKVPDPVIPDPVIPDPKVPDPKIPDPKVNPLADPALVKQFQQALDTDSKTYGVQSGQATWAVKLGNVYLETAKLLQADTSNTLTYGNLYTITFNASTGQKIPRRDQALTEVRKVIDGITRADSGTVLKGTDKQKFIDLWNRIGASLVEAGTR